ncbi:MAG TPA: endonuclease/exonuclease/phosphatase family protein [Polyangiaceae bacterium]|nr:endonuclease/exonuclease/phosphatase family protein [Polyangiaceae bacterium]
MQVLRAATLNVWNRSGPWPERLKLIRRELAALSPDVIGLQEVMRLVNPATNEPLSPELDQAAEIATDLGYRLMFAQGSEYGNGLVMGNAILSRFPILETRSTRLPDVGTGERRVIGYALLETPWGRLPVFVTHFNWRFDHGFVRVKQAVFSAGWIDEIAPPQAGNLPPLFVGDLNAEPESDEIRFLRGHGVQDGKSVHYADAWVYAGDGSQGATFDRKNDYARKNCEPPRRIDYILVRGPDAERRGEPLVAKIVFNTPEPGKDGPVWPSDHFGLYAEIAVEPRNL